MPAPIEILRHMENTLGASHRRGERRDWTHGPNGYHPCIRVLDLRAMHVAQCNALLLQVMQITTPTQKASTSTPARHPNTIRSFGTNHAAGRVGPRFFQVLFFIVFYQRVFVFYF